MKMRFPTYWIGDGTEVKESGAAVVGGRGGTEEIDLKPLSARKLRVKGRRRNTDYGISLFALSVYGSQANPDKK